MIAGPPPDLVGREHECGALDDLLTGLREGGSRVLVVRGEAGIGKSVLLEYVAVRASGTKVTWAHGIEADMELPYASLHQLCTPFWGQLDELPKPQRDALRVAFGMAAGDPPDRFLVGLAVLTLLTRASETQPVLVLVDDAQWLDQVSLQTLEFVARRLLAEAVSMVFAVRDPEGRSALGGLPTLRLDGLDTAAAGELLETSVGGRLEKQVRDRFVAETPKPGPGHGPAPRPWERILNTKQQTTRGLAAIEAYLYQEAQLSAARRRVMAFTETRDEWSREQKRDIESWYLAEQKYMARMVTEHIDDSVGAAEAAHHVRFRRWLRGTLIAMVMLNVLTFVCTAVVVGSVA